VSTHVILASTSSYRAELLTRLGISFVQQNPQIDEEPYKSLPPQQAAKTLAQLKAQACWRAQSISIGSDQVVHLDHLILSKPGTRENALESLMLLSNRTHQLLTAVCIIDGTGQLHEHTDITEIKFKEFNRQQALEVIDFDQPYDCAGAYKIESRGISLVSSIKSNDMTAIQGLPLIAVSRMLKVCGLKII
jgi:septum formation protein